MFDLEFAKNKKRKLNNVSQGNDVSFVKDGMTTDDIRNTVRNIRAYIEKDGNTSLSDRIEKLKQDNKFFYERYPMLFDMCTRPTFDFNSLNYFLQKREEIINNKNSNEEVSKQIGKEWFDKYIDVSKLQKKTDP